jgi:predicted RNase H-like nuclease (RuvC/YqgF family)
MPHRALDEPPLAQEALNKINLLFFNKRIKNRINKRWYPDRLRPRYTAARHRKGNHAGIIRNNRFQDNYKELERGYNDLKDRYKRLQEVYYRLQSQYTELKARYSRLKRRYDRLKRDVDELFYRLTVVSWIVAILLGMIELIRAIREIVNIFAS